MIEAESVREVLAVGGLNESHAFHESIKSVAELLRCGVALAIPSSVAAETVDERVIPQDASEAQLRDSCSGKESVRRVSD